MTRRKFVGKVSGFFRSVFFDRDFSYAIIRSRMCSVGLQAIKKSVGPGFLIQENM